MRIVVTGATGFVGRNLVESFHDGGLKVLATGRSGEVGEELRAKGIEFRQADILDPARLESVFSPADCVIHCAAKTGDWGRRREFYETNVVGTRNVIAACRCHDIERIVFISTPSVYFTGSDRFDIAESEPLPARQVTPYARTKLVAEEELLALQEEGRKTIVLRPRAIIGPYDNTFTPRILGMAEKKRFPLINNGEALVDVTCVDNLVQAVRKSLAAPDHAWNEVYNVSNGDPITIRDWFSQVLSVFDRPFRPKNIPVPVAKAVAGVMELASALPFGPRQPSMTRFSVGYMARSMTMAIDKAKTRLGYEPQISNREGFERYAEWYRAQGGG